MSKSFDWTKTHYIDDDDLYMTAAGIITFYAVTKRFVSKENKKKNPDDKGAFIMTLLVPPKHSLIKLEDACVEAAEDEWGPKKAKGVNMPFADPTRTKPPMEFLKDERDDEIEDLHKWQLVRSNTYQTQPPVFDHDGRELRDAEIDKLIRNGVWARMQVKTATYDNESSGVKLWLDSVQLADPEEFPKYTTPKADGARNSGGRAFARAQEDDGGDRSSRRDRDDDRGSRRSRDEDDRGSRRGSDDDREERSSRSSRDSDRGDSRRGRDADEGDRRSSSRDRDDGDRGSRRSRDSEGDDRRSSRESSRSERSSSQSSRHEEDDQSSRRRGRGDDI